jgi:thiosulfate reductase cytochrome b subunit
MGRRWHFFFAWLFVVNGAFYALYGLFGGHLRGNLLPAGRELRRIGHAIGQHLRFRFPKGDEAKHYNVLQKIAYLVVIFGVAPLIVLTGLTMSPRIDAGFPVLLALFDGRQSARTIHFLCAFGFLLFVLVHLCMVEASGAWNNIRSMITGRYSIQPSGGRHGQGQAD